MSGIYEYLNELRKIELEVKGPNEEQLVLRSYIKSVLDDKILIDAPSKKNVNYNIPDGKEIEIIIQGEDGVYSGTCTVIGKEISGISGIWISHPLNSKRVQRREYVRVELDLSIAISLIKTADNEDKDTFDVKVQNINGKGFSFLSNKPLNAYYDIFCQFKLNDGNDQIIKTRCEHIYSDVKMVHAEMLYKHALAFIDLDDNSTERIVKECFKYQLDERKNKLV